MSSVNRRRDETHHYACTSVSRECFP